MSPGGPPPENVTKEREGAWRAGRGTTGEANKHQCARRGKQRHKSWSEWWVKSTVLLEMEVREAAREPKLTRRSQNGASRDATRGLKHVWVFISCHLPYLTALFLILCPNGWLHQPYKWDIADFNAPISGEDKSRVRPFMLILLLPATQLTFPGRANSLPLKGIVSGSFSYTHFSPETFHPEFKDAGDLTVLVTSPFSLWEMKWLSSH